MVSQFGHALPASVPYPSSNLQGITNYLNKITALHPPLRVEGEPPFLHVYLNAVHVYAIAHLLPSIKGALSHLRGLKYWELYVYIEADLPGRSRLIDHSLLESVSAQRSQLAWFPSMATPESPAIAPTPEAASSQRLPAAAPPRIRYRLARRRHLVRRQRLVASAIAIGGVSFMVGTVAALGNRVVRPWQSAPAKLATEAITESVATSDNPNLPPPATQLKPVLETSTAPSPHDLDSAAAARPRTTLLQPMTPSRGITAAANLLTVPPAIQPAVEIKAVGDIVPGTNFPDYRLPDPNYLFNSVKMFMGEVDILFGNFESTLTNYPDSAKDIRQGMTFAFRTPPEFAGILQAAGFDVLSVANNHSFDFGNPGFEDTIAHIEQTGMRAVGRKDEIVIVEANGYAIAFIGFSYWDDHNNMNNLAAATSLVQRAQASADMVVISVHAGAEGTDALHVRDRTEYFFSENRGNIVQFSRAMIDAGADLILGHGPHVPRAMELYQNKLIAYSLGNFVGYRTLATVGPLGQSLILEVELNPDGDFLRGRIIPVALDTNGIPYIDDLFQSVTLIRQLTAKDFPGTPLAIDQMGYIFRTDSPW